MKKNEKKEKLPLSYIQISKENLIYNIKQFRRLLDKRCQIAGVVKANAYGHGDVEVVSILNPYVDYFQVNSIEEFERIDKVSKKPIFIFGYLDEEGIRRAIKGGAIVSAFDLIHLYQINFLAQNLKKKVKVHLAVDSYLGREGILPDQASKIVLEIKKMKNIILDGVYSHFANIEDIHLDKLPFGQAINFSHAEKQIKTYHQAVKVFQENGFKNIKTHLSATSGILVYEKNNYLHKIVRLGIGLYGLWPSKSLEKLNQKNIHLKPVLRWVSNLAQVKVLPPNHSIGYGLTYITKKKTKIGIVPQGYADGLSRSLSNKGEFLIKGKRVKILGRVAMNMTVVDLSQIKDAKAGQEIVILGQQEKPFEPLRAGNKITAEEIARKTDTINYEVATKISPLLPRIIV